MKKQDYALENRLARILAGSEPGDGAGRALGAAIVQSPEHAVSVVGNTVELVYYNEFGPTCTVDDVLERMTLVDYREACEEAVRAILEAVRGREYRPDGKTHPSVTFVPEPDTPVIHAVSMLYTVPYSTCADIHTFAERRDKKTWKN